MEVTELFTKAFEIFKKNWIIAIPLVAANIIGSIIALVLIGSMAAGMGMMAVGGMTPGIGSIGTFFLLAFVVGILGMIINLLASGMTYVMADDALKGKADLNSGLQKTMANITNLLVASILVGVIIFVGMLLLALPGIAAAYLLMFTLVLVVLDKKAPVDAMQGSFNLVKANIGDTLVFAVIALVLMFVASAYVSIVLVMLYKELAK